MKRITIEDLAREAGVSRATVNRALSGRANVKKQTVEHIYQVADRIGFYGLGAIRSRMRQGQLSLRFGFLLQQQRMPFHAELADAVARASDAWQDEHIAPVVEHMDRLDPDLVAERVHALGEQCDAVAIATADHQLVNQAVEELAAKEKPVFAVISDITTSAKAGYVGIDNRQLGRVAGWYATRLVKPGPEIALLVGTHRHLCQEQREMGFRSFLREHEIEVSRTLTTFETDRGAYEATLDLLKSRPELGALFVIGGGLRGCLKALNESADGRGLVTIGCESGAGTQKSFLNGHLTVALVHPLEAIAEALVANMVESVRAPLNGKLDSVVPFLTEVSEQPISTAT